MTLSNNINGYLQYQTTIYVMTSLKKTLSKLKVVTE